MALDSILVLKTGALGDVLRTTSILPGLAERHPSARVTWLTAHGAAPLVRHHPLVAEVVTLDPRSEFEVLSAARELGRRRWGWVLSFDDEPPLCRLASALPTERLSGAHLDTAGRRVYTADVAPWFDMGLLSVHGKQAADRLKVENRRSHPELFASMLGIRMGRPALPLADEFLAAARARLGQRGPGARIGLNTGAGGRWVSKQLDPGRTVELARLLARALPERPTFVLFGGPEEQERNRGLRAALERHADELTGFDAGTDNGLLEFAALVDACDLLVTSDSLALHVALARGVPLVAFFAPTSADEIELYGLGEKVRSLAPDYCSYRPDADNSSLTPERLCAAALAVLARHPPGGRPATAEGTGTSGRDGRPAVG